MEWNLKCTKTLVPLVQSIRICRSKKGPTVLITIIFSCMSLPAACAYYILHAVFTISQYICIHMFFLLAIAVYLHLGMPWFHYHSPHWCCTLHTSIFTLVRVCLLAHQWKTFCRQRTWVYPTLHPFSAPGDWPRHLQAVWAWQQRCRNGAGQVGRVQRQHSCTLPVGRETHQLGAQPEGSQWVNCS